MPYTYTNYWQSVDKDLFNMLNSTVVYNEFKLPFVIWDLVFDYAHGLTAFKDNVQDIAAFVEKCERRDFSAKHLRELQKNFKKIKKPSKRIRTKIVFNEQVWGYSRLMQDPSLLTVTKTKTVPSDYTRTKQIYKFHREYAKVVRALIAKAKASDAPTNLPFVLGSGNYFNIPVTSKLVARKRIRAGKRYRFARSAEPRIMGWHTKRFPMSQNSYRINKADVKTVEKIASRSIFIIDKVSDYDGLNMFAPQILFNKTAWAKRYVFEASHLCDEIDKLLSQGADMAANYEHLYNADKLDWVLAPQVIYGKQLETLFHTIKLYNQNCCAYMLDPTRKWAPPGRGGGNERYDMLPLYKIQVVKTFPHCESADPSEAWRLAFKIIGSLRRYRRLIHKVFKTIEASTTTKAYLIDRHANIYGCSDTNLQNAYVYRMTKRKPKQLIHKLIKNNRFEFTNDFLYIKAGESTGKMVSYYLPRSIFFSEMSSLRDHQCEIQKLKRKQNLCSPNRNEN